MIFARLYARKATSLEIEKQVFKKRNLFFAFLSLSLGIFYHKKAKKSRHFSNISSILALYTKTAKVGLYDMYKNNHKNNQKAKYRIAF